LDTLSVVITTLSEADRGEKNDKRPLAPLSCPRVLSSERPSFSNKGETDIPPFYPPMNWCFPLLSRKRKLEWGRRTVMPPPRKYRQRVSANWGKQLPLEGLGLPKELISSNDKKGGRGPPIGKVLKGSLFAPV